MKTTALFMVLFFCMPAAVSAGGPWNVANFLYSVTVSGPLQKGRLYRMHLTSEVLRNCGDECADARIFDREGKEIPYVIIESGEKTSGGENYIFEMTGYDEAHGAETVTMRLPERHKAITSMRMVTHDRDFRKHVELYGSRDQKDWSLITKDSIWDFSSQVDLRKTELTFPEADYRYFKLIFSDAQKKPKDEDIRLRYRGDRSATDSHELDFSLSNAKAGRSHIDRVEGSTPKSKIKAVYDELVFSGFSSRKDGDQTIIDIEAVVPFERVSFDIADPYYFRQVVIYFSKEGKDGTYRYVSTGSIYSFPLSDTTEAKNQIECQGMGKGHYRFIVDDRNNPSLGIRSIKFEWPRRYIYFIALGDQPQYSLHFGNSALKKPEYDIVHFINQCNWQTHSAVEVRPAPVVKTAHYKPALPEDRKARIERAILISTVVLLVGVIGYWLYLLLKKTAPRSSGRDY